MLLSSTGPKVLIAEDDTAICELLLTRLEIAGYRTVAAKDGVSAWTLIRSHLPSAVILDVNMPGMDGFSVLCAMRSSSTCSKIPVLMLTARKSVSDVQKARQFGANDYLTKPFEDRLLLTRVERLIRARAARAPRLADTEPFHEL